MAQPEARLAASQSCRRRGHGTRTQTLGPRDHTAASAGGVWAYKGEAPPPAPCCCCHCWLPQLPNLTQPSQPPQLCLEGVPEVRKMSGLSSLIGILLFISIDNNILWSPLIKVQWNYFFKLHSCVIMTTIQFQNILSPKKFSYAHL